MKKYTFALLVLALCSCVRETMEPAESPVSENLLKVTLNADIRPVSKVTFDDGGQLVWEGQDSVALLIGDDSSRGGVRSDNNSLTGKLTAVDDGVFEGIVDLGAFVRDDIQGAIYPYSPDHHYRVFETDGEKTYHLGMMVGGKMDANGNFVQTQKTDNVLHGENITLFANFNPDYTKDHPNNDFEYGGTYLLDDKSFEWASAVLRFNVYGKHTVMDDDEVIKSIVLTPKTAGLAGTYYYDKNSGAFSVSDDAINSSEISTVTVSLEEGTTIADKNQENGVKLYMALRPNGEVTFPAGAELTVYTDKWFYYIPLDGISVNLRRGVVSKIALDMSTAVSPEKTYYSADGGEWTMSLPATFRTLVVKGGLREDMLLSLRDAVRAQENTVELDLSQVVYESVEFPAVFAGESEVIPDESIKSIKFPSNIAKIADGAFKYCKGLETVDLSTVREIGRDAFRYSGLKTIDVPSNVKLVGREAFGDLRYVESIYYNPAIDWASIEEKGLYRSPMANRNNVSEWNDRSNPLTVTIGPDVTELPEYCFDTNARLTELIIEGDNLNFISQWAIRAYNIERIEFKGGLPAVESGSLGGDFAKKLTEYEGVVICPEGKIVEFVDNPVIQDILATGKYMISEFGSEGTVSAASYSSDGQNWYSTIPAAFDKLYVKTDGENSLSISDLYVIKSAMSRQSSVVELDLSQSVYMSETFPALFNGMAADSPVTYIKSIKFPSNVTGIASYAFQYCESLETIDLTGITEIGEYAFAYSGLKTLNVPSSVASIGQFAFAYMKSVTDIYYNVPQTTTQKVLGNRKNEEAWNTADYPLKVTVGQDVKALGDYMFDTNCRLTELVFECENFFVGGNNWLIRAKNIKRIEFKAGPPSADAKTPGGDFAANLATGEGVIICPDGMFDTFNSNGCIQNILATGKYVLMESSEANSVALYSVDGKNWSETLPETFTKLYVSNGSDGVLTASDVVKVAERVAEQTGLVDVDMSTAVFKSSEFPSYFTENEKLKSILFPSNVTAVAANAFYNCTALESVDLSKITVYGDNAFKCTALKTVRLENTVTSLGLNVFRECRSLEEVYFNVPETSYDKSKDVGVFRWDKYSDTEPEPGAELVATIGPDATIPRYGFADNRNLVKLIFEYNSSGDRQIANNATNRIKNLHTVICKSAEGLYYGNLDTTIGANFSGTKYLVVPDGCIELYETHDNASSLYNKLVVANKFTLIEQSDYDAL